MSDHKIPINCYWPNHKEYDLKHLHPFYLDIIAPSKEGKEAIRYKCIVQFSIHCFTKDSDPKEPNSKHYSDSRETRLFCPERYALSFQLPEMVKQIKKGLNTKKGNFLVLNVRNIDGNEVKYKIFFTLSRSSKERGKLNFYINSAYPVTTDNTEKNLRPMALHIIAYKTLNRKIY